MSFCAALHAFVKRYSTRTKTVRPNAFLLATENDGHSVNMPSTASRVSRSENNRKPGVLVDRYFRRTRSSDGSTFVWMAQVRPGPRSRSVGPAL